LELLLLLVIKVIPAKVFGKWGSAVAEAMAGQGGEKNLFSKGSVPNTGRSIKSYMINFCIGTFLKLEWHLSICRANR